MEEVDYMEAIDQSIFGLATLVTRVEDTNKAEDICHNHHNHTGQHKRRLKYFIKDKWYRLFNFCYFEQWVWLAVCLINITTFMIILCKYYGKGKRKYFRKSIWRDQVFNIVVCLIAKIFDYDRVINIGCVILLIETNYVVMRIDRVAVIVNNDYKSSMHVTRKLENQIFNTNMSVFTTTIGYVCFVVKDFINYHEIKQDSEKER